jgi:hypothetical protein
MCQEGTNGTRNRDAKEELRLGNERTTRRIHTKSTELEIAKRIARCAVGLKRIKDWTLLTGQTPPKRKKKAVRGGAGNVKVPATTTTDRKRGEFIRVPLGTNAQKEGAVAMVEEWLPQPGKTPQEQTPCQREKKTLQALALGRKGTSIHR